MVDRIGASLAIPCGGGFVRLRDHRADLRRIDPAQRDGGIDLARQQHGAKVLSRGYALHEGWVLKFLDVRVLLRDPGHGFGGDAVLVLQYTTHPDAGGLRPRAHANALAWQIRWATQGRVTPA